MSIKSWITEKKNKYFKPRSSAWWSGFLLSINAFISGVGDILNIPDRIVAISQFITGDVDPQMLFMQFFIGTGIVGIRGMRG